MDEEIEQLTSVVESLLDYLKSNSAQLIAAIALIIAGFIIARWVSGAVTRLCTKKNIDLTLTRFFSSTTRLIVIVTFLVMAVNKIGIPITPFVALVGASAFGLSLAVQGPLSNYGAGIVLIITRPFKVDDTLTIHGITGLVDSVNLGNTQLMTEDGQEVTIPNRQVLGEILTNSFQLMVVEGVVGIEYSSAPELAIEAVRQALKTVAEVSDERLPQVGIQAFGDSSIDIGYRYWVPTTNYYNIQFKVNLAVFKALKAANISIPFPQRDVRIVSGDKETLS